MNRNTTPIWTWVDSNVYLYFDKLISKEYYSEASRIMDNENSRDQKDKTNNKKVNSLKIWKILSMNDLIIYHKIHHDLSKFIFEEDINIENIYYDKVKVKEISIKILDLWNTDIIETNHIKTKEPVLITHPKIIKENMKSYLFNQGGASMPSAHGEFANIIWWYFRKIWLPWCWFIATTNILFTWFENWKLEITITDLGYKIWKLIQHEEDIYKRIAYNKWKSLNQYKSVPKPEEENKIDKDTLFNL